MKKLLTLTFIIALTSLAVQAFQVDSYSLNVGDSFNITVDQSQKISQVIMGTSNDITTENYSLEELEVVDVSSKGNYTLKLTVLEQKTVVSSPMMSMVEDSENPDIGSGLYPALKNTAYSFTMTPKGEILEIMGLEEIKSTLNASLSGNPQASAQVDALFSEDLIRSTLELRFSYFSENDEMKWTENKSMTMNAMPIEMNIDFSYQNDYTIQADSEISINTSIVQMGTNVDLALTGTQNATYTLDQSSGLPNTFNSINDIIGNASAAGMQIPMTIHTDSKTTFTRNSK